MSTTVSDGRTYATHAQPLWRRALLNREGAIIAALLLVYVVSLFIVPNFDGPLTVTYLLRDVAPILLIALPMTLI
ncbi:MAG TPA: ABC transporter permease, partial [Propionibacterium sp.]|nr:ABC transporter permease [Propionibacterium sp.]